MQDLYGYAMVLLAAAAVVAALATQLRQPTLLGYLLAGIMLGPHVLGVLQPGATLDFLAELGVVLLLFMVGMEFSIPSLWATRRRVLIAGGLQMALVGGATAGLVSWLGADARTATLLGGAAAMSSSALAAKQLADQGELTSRHGRTSIAVLVFQDLATIPLLALLAIWSRGGEPSAVEVAVEVFGVLLLFAAAALLSKPLLQRAMAWVARHGSEDAFLLSGLTIVVAAASGAHALGVSAALGAFLAGMVLGESDFRHRIEDDIRPFRDLLLGLFFITVGLQLDIRQLYAAPLAIAAWLLWLIPAKVLLTWPALRISGQSRPDAWRGAVILGHGGEFGLLLLASAAQLGVLPAAQAQPALVAFVLSMAAAPLLIRHHDRIAQRLAGRPYLPAEPQEEEDAGERQAGRLEGHVVICGAGHIGRLMSQALSLAEIPHLLVESDYEVYSAARADGLPVLYGDASRVGTLRAAGAERARVVAITFHRPEPALRIARWMRHHHPSVSLLATSLTDREAGQLLALPGVRVYLERLAAGLTLAAEALVQSGLPIEAANEVIGRLRQRLQSQPVQRTR